MVRVPLDYQAFVLIVRAAVGSGMPVAEVAEGLGVREVDVVLAWELKERA